MVFEPKIVNTFQSPSGVLGVCRRHVEIAINTHLKFQSPSGVLGVCRAHGRHWQNMSFKVSVPFRGFRGLQEARKGLFRRVTTRCFSPLPGF